MNTMGRAASLVTVGMVAVSAAATASSRPAILIPRQNGTTTNETTSVTFAHITPSSELNWVDCYGPNLQCSYLTVPLDYENPDVGTTDVAFIRYLLSEDAEDLLFNPGGPGESGVEHAVGSGETFAKRWGYNFVSFDPRGVMWTGPRISCSPSNGTSSTKLLRRDGALGDLSQTWNETLTRHEACSAANEHSKAKYVGTSAVVQDMMHFTELQAAARGKDPKEAQVNYYGVSYGTLVGQTLVAMYPDRIRRVLLDGNIHGVSHYQGWEPSGLDDFAHGIWLFSKLCYEAGEQWCILAKDAGSIDEVKARFDTVVDKLKTETVEVQGTSYGADDFLSVVQQCLYFPRTDGNNYLKVANTTWALWNNDTSSISNVGKLLKRDEPAKTGDELNIITATDIAGRFPWTTYELWKAAAERLEETAPYGAKGYASTNGIIGLAMSAFVPPPSQLFPGFTLVNTSAPVLFVNTVADPVTPMSAAHQMSRLFAGSVVFIQNGPGHGYSNSPSKCTRDIIAKYFADATVPPPGTWCETDVEANYYFGGPEPEATQ